MSSNCSKVIPPFHRIINEYDGKSDKTIKKTPSQTSLHSFKNLDDTLQNNNGSIEEEDDMDDENMNVMSATDSDISFYVRYYNSKKKKKSRALIFFILLKEFHCEIK
jgi:hypothetical protein